MKASLGLVSLLLGIAGVGCDPVPAKAPRVDFVLRNETSETIYFGRNCGPVFHVLGASSHAEVARSDYSCGCDCASPSCNSTLTCGACAPAEGVPVAPGETASWSWDAQKITHDTKLGTDRGTISCLRYDTLRPGDYIFAIDLYGAAEDAFLPAKATRREQPFTLGTTDTTVEIPVR